MHARFEPRAIIRVMSLLIIASPAALGLGEAPRQASATRDTSITGTQFADVTGDGLVDAISVNSQYDAQIRISNGFEFGQSMLWRTGFRGIDVIYADVNGDGRADAIIRSYTERKELLCDEDQEEVCVTKT